MSSDFKHFPHPLTPRETQDAIVFMKTHKVAIFIVAYQAEKHIERLLHRIPTELLPYFAEIFIIDDSSRDRTVEVARKVRSQLDHPCINVYRTPFNRGYGGNQKLGYLYCIERGHDVAILLHGDGQYAPEFLARLIAPFNDDSVDAVIASRMITKKQARQGGMPLYKFLGNQLLTAIENRVLGTSLSEFHTGYRAYRTRLLRRLPFQYNDDGFHFDTEIIIQTIAARGRIHEVPIPTHYGDEVCHVNGLQYAWNCIKSVVWFRLTRYGILFDRRFDVNLFEDKDSSYRRAPNSVHQWVLNRPWPEGRKVIDLNPGSGRFAARLAQKGPRVIALAPSGQLSVPGRFEIVRQSLDAPLAQTLGRHAFDAAIMLDGLQRFSNVGDVCENISRIIRPGGVLFVCTGNVAYFPLRLFFLLGMFHYGKRGILDLSHARLFTQRALVRLLENSGFRVRRVRGFGPPLRDMAPGGFLVRKLDLFLSFLARLRPSLFAYQILVEAEKLDDVESILEKTLQSQSPDQSPPSAPDAQLTGTGLPTG
ncbi:MAG: hypothetical protein Kow0059_18940 [Candidatus Sumerlaeia bacterium]